MRSGKPEKIAAPVAMETPETVTTRCPKRKIAKCPKPQERNFVFLCIQWV